MTTILFWNINKKQLLEDIVLLCHQYDVDILILAESEISRTEILQNLNKKQDRIYLSPSNPTSNLAFFYRYSLDFIQQIYGEKRISIQQIHIPLGNDFLLVALHLPSKLFMNQSDQLIQCIRISKIIREIENRVGHSRTLVIGDLNMNPFEDGIMAADGFHGMMTQKIARKRDRIVQGQVRPFFYNPMWGRMGDLSQEAPGTYYYSGSSSITYFWNIFDQVLLRPDLLNYFSSENLHIISQVGQKSLLTENETIRSSSSDHLPIVITLNL